MTKIAILGAGNGGCACAIDLILNGFDVTLCSVYNPAHIKPILDLGGLEYSGKLGYGFAKVKATDNITKAIENANIILIIAPSPLHAKYIQIIAPILKKKILFDNRDNSDTIKREHVKPIILLNGNTTGGSLFVSTLLREFGIQNLPVCETDILNFACRLQSPTHIKIYHKVKQRLFGCFPSEYRKETFDKIKNVFPELKLVDNVLQTSLSNLNAVLHPPGMILNTGWIEHTFGDFLFYSQGISHSVAKVIESVDKERLMIMRKLQLKTETLEEILIRCGFVSSIPSSIYDAIRSSETIRFIKSPESIGHRYLTEDIGYGLVPMTNIARCLDIRTTITDSLINIACLLNNLDHWSKGLTIQKLGINNMDLPSLKRYLNSGI